MSPTPTTVPFEPQRPSLFFALPLELRYCIYAYVFTDEWVFLNSKNATRSFQCSNHPPLRGSMSPLLLTNRELRAEASMMHFSRLAVSCDIPINAPNSPALCKWLAEIGDHNTRLLRTFHLRWKDYVDISIDLAPPSDPYDDSPPPQQPPHSYLTPLQASSIIHHAYALSTITSATAFFETPSPTPKPHTPFPLSLPSTLSPLPPPLLPSSLHRTPKFQLVVRGIQDLHLPPYTYWEQMGTPHFCQMLGTQLSAHLETVLGNRDRAWLERSDIERLVRVLDEHASALKWLWIC